MEGELEMLARRVLEDAKTTSVAWKAIWKSRETGGDVQAMLYGWLLFQQGLARSITTLILACDQDADATTKALAQVATEKR